MKVVLLLASTALFSVFFRKSHWTYSWGRVLQNLVTVGIIAIIWSIAVPQLKSQWLASRLTGPASETATAPSQSTSAPVSPEQQAVTTDPVIHIEPENSLVWSTTPGRTKGVFQLTLYSTSHNLDHVTIEETYFVAEKSQTDLKFKSLGGIPQDYEHSDLLKAGQPFIFSADFRSYVQIAKEVMIDFNGPSLFGVKILVRYRRHVDGKAFTFSKGYAAINPTAPGIYDSDSEHVIMATEDPERCPGTEIFSDGFGYQTDSLNADEFAGVTGMTLPPCGKKTKGHFPIPPKGVLRLSDLEFYFNLPGHWVPVAHEIPSGKYH